MKYLVLMLIAVVVSCATTERSNPFDAHGTQWYPPLVVAKNDTIVSFNTTASVVVGVRARDTNPGGRIVKYYWDRGVNGWDDSTDVASYRVTPSEGGPVELRWAARDDDGVFAYDTFRVLFNRPPSAASVVAPTALDSWLFFDASSAKGSFPLTLGARDPDSGVDTLRYTLYTGSSAGGLTRAYTGKDSICALDNIDSSATRYYRLVVKDLFGDSVESKGTFVAPPPPGAADYDGNFYPAVTIGTQYWTTVNLRTTHFNDGSPIAHVSDMLPWSLLSSAGYCFYDNSADRTYQQKWGALYNWYAANSATLAPPGWRVPTDADWEKLEQYLQAQGTLGVTTTTELNVAKAMAAQTGWSCSAPSGSVGNTGSTNNSSGFSALPAGFRNNVGIYFLQNVHTVWWSATEFNAEKASSHNLSCFLSRPGRNEDFKQFGFSVRLVRDVD